MGWVLGGFFFPSLLLLSSLFYYCHFEGNQNPTMPTDKQAGQQ
jgi:hypothetical protein